MVQGVHHLLTCPFSCRPKCVREVLGDDSTANGGRLPILRDRDAAQLAQMDLDAMGHFAQRGDGSMCAIGGEKRQRVLVCEVDLSRRTISKLVLDTRRVREDVGEKPYRFDNVMFSVGNNDDVRNGGAQVGPASHSSIELAGAWQVNLGISRELRRQLRIVHTTTCWAIGTGLETGGRDVLTGSCCRPRREGSELQLTIMHGCGRGKQQKRN